MFPGNVKYQFCRLGVWIPRDYLHEGMRLHIPRNGHFFRQAFDIAISFRICQQK